PAERAVRIAEQPIESVDHAECDHVLALAPALVTSQAPPLGERLDVAASLQLLREHLHERRTVEESQVDALPRERMDRMRRIADEGEAVFAVLTCVCEAQGKVHARRCDLDLAEDT